MNDYLVRIIAKSGSVRALACVTTGLVNEVCRRHGTWPTASAALGRALTGGALLAAQLKTGQRIGLKFEGNGPLQKILVEADSNGEVRGCVGNPEVHLAEKNGKLDVAGALGKAGFLTVTMDQGGKAPYKGTVQLYSSEIAEDLALYLTESEQIPSAVGLGVFVEVDNSVAVSGGFLIQAMPSVEERVIESLMARIEGLPPLSEMLLGGMTPEELLAKIFADIPYDTLEKRALAFNCSCSKQRIERVLISLGRTELADMLEKDGKADVTCEFCREAYHFDQSELVELLKEIPLI